MDCSPETNPVAATSSSPVSSSPPVQESPFSNFLSNLTPINTVKSESYTQLGTFLPTPPVVFTSPHIDLLRENSFLERNDIVEAGSNVDVYKECNTNIVQNPSFEKEVQLSSASGCIDEYLADPKVDCTNSAGLHLKPANDVSQLLRSGITVSKESNTEVHEVIDGSTKNEALTSSSQAEENMPSRELIESTTNQSSVKNSDELPRFSSVKGKESAINVDLVSQAQSQGQNTSKSSGDQYAEQNATVQLYEDLNERKRKVLEGSVKEVSQHHRGIRRHLQFETAVAHKSTTFGNNESLWSLTHDTANLRSPSNLTNLRTLASSHFDNKAPSGPQAVSCDTSQLSFCPHDSVRSVLTGGNSSTSAPIHSGIGLHLNSVSKSTSMSSDVFSSRKSTGYLSTTDQMLDHDIKKDSSSSFISGVPGENYSCVGDGQQESQSAADTSSFTFYSTDGMPYLPCDSLHHILVDQQPVSCEVGDASQDANKVEESNQLSQTRKRRKGAEISDGCKRCNCRKSKCLKLYCECFAAGVFCLDSCACENCYNKPEFEDTVFDTRQQIESRNPLAFAPKVVKHEIDSLPNITEEADWMTPSSARHKRGCNCKKSKCLKKYCECYQANVGCSGACRCDGCQNPCGTKADQEYNRAEKWETHPAEKLDTIKGGNDCIKAANINPYSPSWEGLCAISNLTPLSHPCSSMKVSSASSSLRNTKISQSHLQSSKLQSSGTGRFKVGRSPVIFTPQVYESKGPYQLSSDDASCERTYDDAPEILKEASYTTKVVKASSPNQKRVSPPQSRAKKVHSSSPRGLRSGRKFILQAVPSFPPLSPYTDSKDAINDTRNSRKDNNNI